VGPRAPPYWKNATSSIRTSKTDDEAPTSGVSASLPVRQASYVA